MFGRDPPLLCSLLIQWSIALAWQANAPSIIGLGHDGACAKDRDSTARRLRVAPSEIAALRASANQQMVKCGSHPEDTVRVARTYASLRPVSTTPASGQFRP